MIEQYLAEIQLFENLESDAMCHRGTQRQRQVKTENLLSKQTQAVCCSLARLSIHRTGKIFQEKQWNTVADLT